MVQYSNIYFESHFTEAYLFFISRIFGMPYRNYAKILAQNALNMKIFRFRSSVLFSIGALFTNSTFTVFLISCSWKLKQFYKILHMLLLSLSFLFEQDVQPVMLLSPIGILKKMVYFFVKRITGLDMEKLANSAVR